MQLFIKNNKANTNYNMNKKYKQTFLIYKYIKQIPNLGLKAFHDKFAESLNEIEAIT